MSINEIEKKGNRVVKNGIAPSKARSAISFSTTGQALSDGAYVEEEFDIVPEEGRGVFHGGAKHIVVVVLIILAAGTAFGIGQISHNENVTKPLEVKSSEVILPYATTSPSAPLQSPTSSKTPKQAVTSLPTLRIVSSADGTVVASKTGTKYYFPWCGGAKRILEVNKVHYASAAEARKAGLTPSSTCKGLR